MGTTIDITKTQKNPGRIYFGLAVPAASQYLTLVTGVPDATENPLAKLVGLTEGGSTINISRTLSEEYFDEFKHPLERNIDQVNASIKADASQVIDEDLVALVTSGATNALTPAGKKAFTIGENTLNYSSVAVVAPLKSDPTKYAVFHLYRAYQVAPFEMQVSRQTRAKVPLEFQGVGITSRAVTDQIGAYWWQTA
jgi:hypothetical protein